MPISWYQHFDIKKKDFLEIFNILARISINGGLVNKGALGHHFI